jgi:hypothetical protein
VTVVVAVGVAVVVGVGVAVLVAVAVGVLVGVFVGVGNAGQVMVASARSVSTVPPAAIVLVPFTPSSASDSRCREPSTSLAIQWKVSVSTTPVKVCSPALGPQEVATSLAVAVKPAQELKGSPALWAPTLSASTDGSHTSFHWYVSYNMLAAVTLMETSKLPPPVTVQAVSTSGVLGSASTAMALGAAALVLEGRPSSIAAVAATRASAAAMVTASGHTPCGRLGTPLPLLLKVRVIIGRKEYFQ